MSYIRFSGKLILKQRFACKELFRIALRNDTLDRVREAGLGKGKNWTAVHLQERA